MKFSQIEIPSNRNFGFLCTFVFVAAATHFYYSTYIIWSYVFLIIAFVFLLVTMVKSDMLLPLNKLWMRFGFLLGVMVSPIVLGIIFFALFTPISMFLRFVGRDELRLKFTQKPSYWILRSGSIKSESFKNQF